MTFWTDARIAQLTRMWNVERLTATQIVVAFSYAVTRNAVIGKVHRLGLDTRTQNPRAKRTPSGYRPPSPPDWAERRCVILDVQANGGSAKDAAIRLGLAPSTVSKAAKKLRIPFRLVERAQKGQRRAVSLPRAPRAPMDCKPVPAAPEPSLSLENSIAFMDQRNAVTRKDGVHIPGTCKWPVTDDHPMRFCGATQARGAVYCWEHNAIAYQRPPDRRAQVYPVRR